MGPTLVGQENDKKKGKFVLPAGRGMTAHLAAAAIGPTSSGRLNSSFPGTDFRHFAV
jgi:hypothetical protein